MIDSLSHRLLSLALAVSGAVIGITTDTMAQSQRARQGPQTPAPIPGPIVPPSPNFPLKQIGYTDGVSPEPLGRIPAAMPAEDAARLGLETTLAVMRKAEVA